MVINDEDGKQAALLVSRSAAVTGQKHNVVGSSPDTSVRVDFVKVQAVLLPNGLSRFAINGGRQNRLRAML